MDTAMTTVCLFLAAIFAIASVIGNMEKKNPTSFIIDWGKFFVWTAIISISLLIWVLVIWSIA